MQKLRNILFFSLGFFCVAFIAHAQTGKQFQVIDFVVSPEVPGPNESVTIETQGVGGFLGDALFTWQKDGKRVLSGVGERNFSFTTGGIGVTTRVRVDIHSSTQGDFSKDFVLVPSYIHLIWEANTSVPPFYRGKSLYSAGSQIKVVALPQVISGGSYISSNRLSYQWSVGDEPVVEASGVGRSTFTFYGNQLDPSETITLKVFYGGGQVGSASLTLPAVLPGVLLYVQDPLRGVLFDQALPQTISLVGQELSINAQPLYFANESLSGNVSYLWTLNGQEVVNASDEQNVLTLRQSGSGMGQSIVSLELQNNDTYKFLQSASAQLRIIFGVQTNGGSSFGL